MIDTARSAQDRPLSMAPLDLPRRLLVAAALVATGMLPVGMFLAALGVLVLKVSGGAANDTSLVIAVAAYLVTDFWGGGIVAALTKVDARRIAISWAITRGALLLAIAIFLHDLAPLLPIQLGLAVPAAFFGARMSHKQASLRRAAAPAPR